MVRLGFLCWCGGALLILFLLVPVSGASAHAASPMVVTRPAATGHVAGMSFYYTAYRLGQWPQATGPYPPGRANCTRDSQGVCVFVENGKTYDQPTFQALDGLEALASYQQTHSAAGLAAALLEANHLVHIHTRAIQNLSVWWFPFRFNLREYNGLEDYAPWYSGMTQGRVLDLFTRLFMVTGDFRWEAAAYHTYLSFLMPLLSGQSIGSHAWCDRTSNGWLWVEEYPRPNPDDDVLNGFGVAIEGLIDYAHAFHSAQATLLAQGALSTFLYAVRAARHPGGPSAYSLSELWHTPTNYHVIVTNQLKLFAFVTGGYSFATMASEYYSDYH